MNISCRLPFLSVFIFVSVMLMECGQSTPLKKTTEVKKDTMLLKKVRIQIGTDSIENDFRKRIVRQPLGDINGDGIEDTATIYPPRFNHPSDPEQGCLHDSCYCRIRFSCNLPDIYPVIGIGETLEPVGDLNGDGFIELAFVPDWMTSVWHSLSVYGIKDGKWKLRGQGDINIEMMDADPDFFRHRVVRIDDSHFKIISDSFSIQTESIVQTPQVFTIH
jgi:hypothetical protein